MPTMSGEVMIIQTGMRTDIPAFYSEWFANRLREGYVLTRNPYNASQVTRYSLDPKVVDLIAFCSKNPGPMLKYTDLLKPYAGSYWFVTITPYGRDYEPNVPKIDKVIEEFKAISRIVGSDSMGWRYDPIFINDIYTVEKHLEAYEHIASELSGYTRTSVISFIDLYQKVRKNFPEARTVGKADRLYLGEEMIKIAGSYGMTVKPCAEGKELAQFGADCRGCMTTDVYERAIGLSIDFPKKKPLRQECECFMGNDIGAYNTCPHLCRYCYANYDEETVRRNYRLHDPLSPFLIGGSLPGDAIHEADQKSYINGQMTLDMFL